MVSNVPAVQSRAPIKQSISAADMLHTVTNLVAKLLTRYTCQCL